jgi:putative nucleotidyltransferase with HDIG domain
MQLSNLQAIIVEDDPADAELILCALRTAGFQTDAYLVKDEGEFRSTLVSRNSSIEVIISDYVLPQFSAPNVLRIIQEFNLDIPLIVVSNANHDQQALEIVQQGAVDYLYKDRLSRLGLAVTNALREKQLRKNLHSLNSKLQEAYDETLQGWAHALELRDDETREHTERVTRLTVKLANKMGVDWAQLKHIRRGALLHDIGKLGIPDYILLKEGPLDEREWKIMKMHPVFAYEMLSPIQYLKPALEIPCYHHEKWDGSGYPTGLAGKEIPLSARIFAVVDVWDALNSKRPYRPEPWPKDKILAYLQDQTEKHFDPAVVNAFLGMIRLNGHHYQLPGR